MRKKRITEIGFVKGIAFVLTVASWGVAIAALAGTLLLSEGGYYSEPLEQLVAGQIRYHSQSDARSIMTALFRGDWEEARHKFEDTNLRFLIEDVGTKETIGTYQGDLEEAMYAQEGYWNTEEKAYYVYQDYYSFEKEDFFRCEPDGADWELTLFVDASLPIDDDYHREAWRVRFLFDYRMVPLYIAPFMALIGLCFFLFLMCCAGRKYGEERVRPSGFARIPYELVLLFLLGSFVVGFEPLLSTYGLLDFGDGTLGSMIWMVVWSVGISILGAAAVVGCLYVLAVQVKAGAFLRGTLIGRGVRLLQRICRWLHGVLRTFFRYLPMTWKAPLLLILVYLVEVGSFIAGGEFFFLLWAVERVALFGLASYFAIVLYRLQTGAKRIADGQMDYQVDTAGMFGECRQHGENLNRIGESMNQIVEDRLKSERMKTELITNVSHDIKTPLTSIINYADLISEETTENQKIMEYSMVLKRQSSRLRKLIEDLVEVSKASTGNLEVNLAACDAEVLLTQVVGEYEQRLEDQQLELVAKHTDEPLRILADGKLLWRVFDNLLNNIIKYAQPGTRVYITVEKAKGQVEVAFKNTSRYQLDISAEELKERFVRGDRSRSTEGTGLGLSIAESLTTLQGGTLDLTVDGDLFKVVLKFPCLAPEKGV